MYTNEKDMIKVLEIICSKTFYNSNDINFDFFVYQRDLDIQKINIHVFKICANTLFSLDFLEWNEYENIQIDFSEKVNVFKKENLKEYIEMKNGSNLDLNKITSTKTDDVLASYSVKKDVWTLLNKLKNGITFDDSTSNNQKDKIDYNVKTRVLKIEEIEIEINPKGEPPQEHYILEYMFKNGHNEIYDYNDLIKLNILDNKNYTAYYNALRNLNNKIEKILNNKKKFMIAPDMKNGNIRINPLYK